MANTRLLGLFEPVKKLGQGGMGAVYEVVADPASPNFFPFLADTMAWREAIAEDRFPEIVQPIYDARSTLDELVASEINLQDTSADVESIQGVKERIKTSKILLQKQVSQLRAEQARYVQKRKKDLVEGCEPQQLIDSLYEKFGITFPADWRFAMKYTDRASKNFKKRLKNEWHSLIALNHPNIIKVYSGGENYYIMEFIKGETLKNILKSYTIGDKLRIIIDAAKGLAHAHNHGIIHRDVKPDNLLTVKDAKSILTKVVDFGLAKGDTSMDLTRTSDAAGTPYYMSKEQFEGAKNCTELSDIYSLGASLYHLMTGLPPYHNAENIFKMKDKIDRKDLLSPRAINGMIPSDLEKFILTAMEIYPSQRLQSMDEVADWLQEYLKIEEQETLKNVTFEDVQKSIRKHLEVRQRKRASNDARPVVNERKPREQFKKPKTNAPLYIGLAAGAAILTGVFLFSGNNKRPARKSKKNTAHDIKKEDFTHIPRLYKRLEANYSQSLHQRLLTTINEVPKDKRKKFKQYIEKADKLENKYKFNTARNEYQTLLLEYAQLEKDPAKEAIEKFRRKKDALFNRLSSIKGVDTAFINPNKLDLNGLSAIVDRYDQARTLVDECNKLAQSSNDMRYAKDIKDKKKEVKRLIQGAEKVKAYSAIQKGIESIALGDRPTLSLDFTSKDDLKYLQDVLDAEGRIENGRFIGTVTLKGICSFDYKRRTVDNKLIEGHGFYNGKYLTINGKVFDTGGETIKGKFDKIMVYQP